MTSRDKARRLIEELPEAVISEVVDFMEFLSYRSLRSTPVPKVLAEAPLDDESVTPEEEAEVEVSRRQAQTGDVLSWDELKQELGL